MPTLHGDAVEPVKIDWPLFSHRDMPLFADELSLMVYPVEAIFSEKLETVIARGGLNSRMKDFHDLYLLCKSNQIMDLKTLIKNINETFKNRETDFIFPIQFSNQEIMNLNSMWLRHLRVLDNELLDDLGLPSGLAGVLEEINTFLMKLGF